MISQYIVIWTVHDMILTIDQALLLTDGQIIGVERAIEVMGFISTISAIVMMYGISDSVKNAREAEERLKQESMTDDEIASLLVVKTEASVRMQTR